MAKPNKSHYRSQTFSYSIIPLSLIFLGASLRFYLVDRTLGGRDENELLMSYVYFPLKHIVTTFGNENTGGHHVFHSIILHFVTSLFGEDNAYAIRGPAFFSGIICLWLTRKTSLVIFKSEKVANIALLITAISPIHIYYSQTARGYSLSVLLSLLMIYASIRLLDNFKRLFWAFILVISGFLTIYTISIFSVMVFVLGVWMFFISTISPFCKEFSFQKCRFPIIYLISLFGMIGVLSFIAYIPLLDQIISNAENRFMMMLPYKSRIDIAINFLPNLISRFFPESLQIFTIFIFIGILFANPLFFSFRLLPIFFVMGAYLISIISGVAWFPRSYLYCLPILIIFLSAGIVWASELLAKIPSFKLKVVPVIFLIISSYVIFTISILSSHFYPSGQITTGKEYQKKVSENTNLNDLILTFNSGNFLYVRKIYKKNYQQIIETNSLSGIKIISKNRSTLAKKEILGAGGPFKPFPKIQEINKLIEIPIDSNRNLYTISNSNIFSLIDNEFGKTGSWRLVSGKGNFSKKLLLKPNNEYSYILQPKPNIIIEASFPEIKIESESYAIVTWCGSSFYPELVIKKMSFKNFGIGFLNNFYWFHKIKNNQFLRTGEINSGMNTFTKIKYENSEKFSLLNQILLGRIPSGTFKMALRLNAKNSRPENYSCLRVFFSPVIH